MPRPSFTPREFIVKGINSEKCKIETRNRRARKLILYPSALKLSNIEKALKSKEKIDNKTALMIIFLSLKDMTILSRFLILFKKENLKFFWIKKFEKKNIK